MNRLLNDIKNCDECGCKTDELYLTNTFAVLCADCEADFTTSYERVNKDD